MKLQTVGTHQAVKTHQTVRAELVEAGPELAEVAPCTTIAPALRQAQGERERANTPGSLKRG